MKEFVFYARDIILTPGWTFWRQEPVWVLFFGVLFATFAANPAQGFESASFVVDSFQEIMPFLLFSVLIAAYINATNAEGLISKAFSGSPGLMIVFAAVAGGISPLCSCGVVPLIGALLRMGVPMSAVMAFCLASPVMDPSMFAVTIGILGGEFAVAKTLAAIGIGLTGGFATYGFEHAGYLKSVLRDSFASDCGGKKYGTSTPGKDQIAVWRFWRESKRIDMFRRQSFSTSMFFARWLSLAFLLESLMLVYVPAEWILGFVGGQGLIPILTATVVGTPAYLNGFAALPLLSGLLHQGMSPGAALSFVVAGSITSIPAAVAVWALAKPQVFGLYLALALIGSFAVGVSFQIWTAQ